MQVSMRATTDFSQVKRVMRMQFRNGIRDAIHETGEYVRNEARRKVPIDTGALRASLTVSSKKSDDYEERKIHALRRLEKAKRDYIRSHTKGARTGMPWSRPNEPHSSPEEFTSGPTEQATREFLSHKPVLSFVQANMYPLMPYAEAVEIGHHSVPAKPYMIPAAAVAQRDVDAIMASKMAEVFGQSGRFKGKVPTGAPKP